MVMCQWLCGNGYVSTAVYERLLCQWLRMNGFVSLAVC